jgi:hypothetical protein
LFTRRQVQCDALVVVRDDRLQHRESSTVVKAAFQMREQHANRRGSVTLIRGATGLKVVNADLGWRMKIPPGIGLQRFDMTVVAASLAAEQRVATFCRGRIETAGGRLR